MKIVLLIAVPATLLALATPAPANPVQSTTSTYVSVRDCIAGETVCDAIGPTRHKAIGGEPGGQKAHARLQDTGQGVAIGTVNLADEPGTAAFSTELQSIGAQRNASTSFAVQRIDNASAHRQTLTLEANLAYDQQVPEENAAFPADKGTHSGVLVSLDLFSITAGAFDFGATAEENWELFHQEPPAGYKSLGRAGTDGLVSNTTGRDTETLSISVTLEPGARIWMFAMLQAVAANGAQVNAELATRIVMQPE